MARKKAAEQKEENELVHNILHDTEALAEAIERLDEVANILYGSRLRRKAILVLLAHYTKLPQRDIDIVLNGLANIKREYLK